MKRMTIVILTFLAATGLGAALLVRHARRTAPEIQTTSDSPPSKPNAVQAVDTWQTSIKVDARTDYRPNPAATKRLMEKLREEEMRQKPWEGRN